MAGQWSRSVLLCIFMWRDTVEDTIFLRDTRAILSGQDSPTSPLSGSQSQLKIGLILLTRGATRTRDMHTPSTFSRRISDNCMIDDPLGRPTCTVLLTLEKTLLNCQETPTKSTIDTLILVSCKQAGDIDTIKSHSVWTLVSKVFFQDPASNHNHLTPDSLQLTVFVK